MDRGCWDIKMWVTKKILRCLHIALQFPNVSKPFQSAGQNSGWIWCVSHVPARSLKDKELALTQRVLLQLPIRYYIQRNAKSRPLSCHVEVSQWRFLHVIVALIIWFDRPQKWLGQLFREGQFSKVVFSWCCRFDAGCDVVGSDGWNNNGSGWCCRHSKSYMTRCLRFDAIDSETLPREGLHRKGNKPLPSPRANC